MPRPKLERSVGKSLLAEPESLAVVTDEFQACATTVGEQKHPAAHRILTKLCPANSGQSVDATPEVNGIHVKKNPHVWRQLNHLCKNACMIGPVSQENKRNMHPVGERISAKTDGPSIS